jgi:hypothetical protein
MKTSRLISSLVAGVFLSGISIHSARADSCLNPEFAAIRNFPTGGQFPFPGSFVVTDINGDTNLDLVVMGIGCPGCTPSTTNTLSVLFGGGDGTFSTNVVIRVDSTLGEYVTAGDLTGDQRPDLVTTRNTGSIVNVFVNNGNGTFQAPTSVNLSNGNVGPVIFDLNHDDSLDLVSGGFVAFGAGNGTFAATVQVSNGGLSTPPAVGDFNFDGITDIAGISLDPFTEEFWIHTVLGGNSAPFTVVTNSPVTVFFSAMAAGRFNADNFTDIAGVSTGKFVGVCLSNGDGTFQPNVNYALPSNGVVVVVDDFNNDNKRDLAVLTVNFTISVLMGNGDGTFQTAINYPYEGNAIPSRLATGDVNGDGFADILAGNGQGFSGISVLLSNGDGTFQVAPHYATCRGPYRPVAGDFTGDGKRDLVVVNSFTNGVAILLNNGDGTFGTNVYYNTGRQAQSAALGDFNKDGKLDLIVASTLSNRVALLMGVGNGTFQTNVLISGSALAGGAWNAVTGDFNGDGNLDFVVTTLFGMTVFPGNSNGTFQTEIATAISPVSIDPDTVITADFNNDNKLDIAYSRTGSNLVCVILGNGSGGFGVNNNFPMSSNMYGVASADFNNDGKADLVTTHYPCTGCGTLSSYTIRLGNGNGTFQPPVNHQVPALFLEGVVTGDFNGDGRADLALNDLLPSHVLVLLGNGDGTFGTPIHFNVGLSPESFCAADLDGNDTIDLVTANKAVDNVSVLLNNCPFPPPPVVTCFLTPLLATNNVGTAHTVTASVTSNGAAAVGVLVNFTVTGVNAGNNGSATTGVAGQGSFTYTGSATPGTDTVRAVVGTTTSTVTKVWIINSCPTITVSPTSLPDGTVGVDYSQAITATGGQAPRTFTVTAGVLPDGLFLSSAGTLSGTPTTAGVPGFTVTATDANDCTGNRAYTVTVNDVPPGTHDLAVVKLKAPKKITFKSGVASVTGKFTVSIQNTGAVDEMISSFATLQDLLTVSVQSLSNCPNFTATMTLPKKTFPLTLGPKKKLTLAFTGIFNCVNDPLPSSKTAPHPDFRTVATVDLSVLGETDTTPTNDDCPRPPSGSDPGCGNKTPAGTLGGDVLTDVIVK